MPEPTPQSIYDELTSDSPMRAYLPLAQPGGNLKLLTETYTQGDSDKRLRYDDLCSFLATGVNIATLSNAADSTVPIEKSAGLYLVDVTMMHAAVTPGTVDALKVVFGLEARPLLDQCFVSVADQIWDRDPTIDEVNEAALL